jgi:primosomal protein N'
LQVLKSAYLGIEDLKKDNPQEFIFLNKMHSPIKKIQGKVRYQVLMRLRTNKLIEKIYEVAAQSSSPKAVAYVEENPSNLS